MLRFLLDTVIISLTGVLAPGPVTALTMGRGSRSPFAGIWISLGHGAVEIPLMVLLLLGFSAFLKIRLVTGLIGLLGGLFLLYLGIGMFREMKRAEVPSAQNMRKPFVSGMLLSIGNPYFLLWWAIVGLKLIERSRVYGMIGFVLFAVVHWMCDLVWLFVLSLLSYRGKRFYGGRFQRLVFAVCGVALLFFSGRFIFDAVRTLARL